MLHYISKLYCMKHCFLTILQSPLHICVRPQMAGGFCKDLNAVRVKEDSIDVGT